MTKRPSTGEIVLEPSEDEQVEPEEEKIPVEVEKDEEKSERKKSLTKPDTNLVDEIMKETEDFRKAVRLSGVPDETKETKQQEPVPGEKDETSIPEPPREPSPDSTMPKSDTPKTMKTPPPVKPKPRKKESQEEIKSPGVENDVSSPEVVRRKISKELDIIADEPQKEARVPRAFVKSLVKCFSSGTPQPVEDILISDEGISPTSSIGGQSDSSEDKRSVDRNSMLSDNGIFEEKIMIPRTFVSNQIKRFSVGGEDIPLLNIEKEVKRARERMADAEKIKSLAMNFQAKDEVPVEPSEHRVVPFKVKAQPSFDQNIKVMGKPKVLARDITDIYRGKMIADMTLVPENFMAAERVKKEEKETSAENSAVVGWRLREYFEEGAPKVDQVVKISSQRVRQRNAVGQRVDFVMGKKDVYQITQFKTAESQVSSESVIKLQSPKGSDEVPFVMATPTYGRNLSDMDANEDGILATEKKDEKNFQSESHTKGPSGSSRKFVRSNETKRQVQSQNSNYISHSTSSEAYIEMNESGFQNQAQGGFSDFEDGMHPLKGRTDFPKLQDRGDARRRRSDDEEWEPRWNKQIDINWDNDDASRRRFVDDEMDDMRPWVTRGAEWSLPIQRQRRNRFSDDDSDDDSFFKGGFGKKLQSRHRLIDSEDSDFGSLRSEIRERFKNKNFLDDDDEDDWIGRSRFRSDFGSGFGRPMLSASRDENDFNTFPMMKPIGGTHRRDRRSDGEERGQILNINPGLSGENVEFDIAASKSVRIRGPSGQTEIKVVSDGDEDGQWGRQNVGIVGYTLPGHPYQIDSLRAGGVKIKAKK